MEKLIKLDRNVPPPEAPLKHEWAPFVKELVFDDRPATYENMYVPYLPEDDVDQCKLPNSRQRRKQGAEDEFEPPKKRRKLNWKSKPITQHGEGLTYNKTNEVATELHKNQ